MIVNIDTVKAIFKTDEPIFQINQNGSVVSYDENEQKKDEFGNRVAVEGKLGLHNLSVRALKSNRNLMVEGSFFAFHFGQNLYTFNSMKVLCRNTFKKVIRKFDIKMNSESVDKLMAGDVDLHRVDLAINFDLETDKEVVSVLKQIRRQLTERGPRTSTNKTSTMWSPAGAGFEIVFYDKGKQVNFSPKYRKVLWRRKIQDLSNGMLRVEVRLHRKKLEQLGLDKVSAWSKETPIDVFKRFFNELPETKIASGPFDFDELVDLPGPLKHVWALIRAGVDIDYVYSPRSIKRYKAQFKKLGIDINVMNFPEYKVVPLAQMLTEDKVKPVPAWMRRKGLYPKSKKSKLNS